MEQLIGSIERSCYISPAKEYVSKRKSLYKYSNVPIDSAREKRRVQLLAEYKRKRDFILLEKRGLLHNEFKESDAWMDWEEPKKNALQNPACKNILMLSEWMMDCPQDLALNWTCVICPEGRRTLVVAKRGRTSAYHKSGLLLATFKSILPFGCPANNNGSSHQIILDCIWKEKTRELFALDVLFWVNQPLLDCDAQFRLYWLQTKMIELRKSLEGTTLEDGIFDVYLPHQCQVTTLSEALAEHEPAKVDGVLFYHNHAPYISKQTPLVGWLKPYMLPERMGVSVPLAYLDRRPPSYVNLEEWVAKFSHSHFRKTKKLKEKALELAKGKEMDLSNSDSAEVSTNGNSDSAEVSTNGYSDSAEVSSSDVQEDTANTSDMSTTVME